MFIAQGTEAGRAEQEEPAGSRLKPEPAGSQHAQEMPARKQEHVAVSGADALDHSIRPAANLLGRLAFRTAIAKQLPVRPLVVDVHRAAAFVLAVIPLK